MIQLLFQYSLPFMLIATQTSLPQEAVLVSSLWTSWLCTLLVIFKIAYLQTLHITLEIVGFFISLVNIVIMLPHFLRYCRKSETYNK